MTRLFNDPDAFAAEMVDGFCEAHRTVISRVPGGVVRARDDDASRVALVIGGGSGHYPAFCGMVGPGLAHGAVMGNLFASPSAQQVYSVADVVDRGSGVLLCYGNYAGDVLNFSQAESWLRAEGRDIRSVVVTDDIASATPDRRDMRRGIAGDVVVFKIAGAASETGLDLDDVERIARKANERTRSLGVAFNGCTLPGADRPLFTVPAGRMAVGLGIHGEPGISEQDTPSADELAALLVDALLAERPDEADGWRVAVIVNGLGAVKHEELYVVYRAIAARLREQGHEVVDPEVGELVTSFDMAGLSLTITWLDDELEALWRAPAESPAFRKGTMSTLPSNTEAIAATSRSARPASPSDTGDALVLASGPSRSAARAALACLRAGAQAIEGAVGDLGTLDSIAGDGDHGIGMRRGIEAATDAAVRAVDAGAGIATVLTRAADAWANAAGGTSGALWGIGLRALAGCIDDFTPITPRSIADGVADATAAIQRFGGARLGDKTMLDSLLPFSDILSAAVEDGLPLAEAWAAASEACSSAAAATAQLAARTGRARAHGDRSKGFPDPGATSLALVTRAMAEALAKETVA